ncbi:MAG TPA: serine hydrolase domain-containing protein [Actinomycetota bacterium]|nr:serine hydrolase domain-containing protein [Actinomycetota bacterium]
MDEVQRLLDQLVAAGAPGAAGWVEDEQGGLGAASGLADLETGRPMVPGLRFRAGSVTKSLVATVVLRLVAEGRLSLSDTVERRLPGILAYGDRVTVRQLLNHTGGVPNNWAPVEQTLYGSPEGRLRAWTPEELVALVADQPQAFRAGSAWSYSNTGYILLGLVVEAVTGHTLAEELGRGIFRPLGLRDSLLPGDDPDIPPPTSSGYSLPLGPPGQVPDGPLLDLTVQNPSWAGAAGGLVSTLGDLTRFFRALLGGRLLPPRLLTEMLPAVTVPSRSLPLPLYDQYGLGLLEVETPAGRLVGNAGGIPGFLSIVLSTRDGRRQLGVMVNVLLAPDPVYEAFIDGFRTLGVRLLSDGRP